MTRNNEDKLLFQLRINGDSLECLESDQQIWRTPINALLLIAEYTTNAGPWGDDYFLNFWSWERGEFVRSAITAYAVDLNETFQILGRKLGTELKLELIGSTEWASRVMWPPQLTGYPYFTFREIPPANWREKLSYRCFGPMHEYSLTKEVQEFLERCEIPHSHS